MCRSRGRRPGNLIILLTWYLDIFLPLRWIRPACLKLYKKRQFIIIYLFTESLLQLPKERSLRFLQKIDYLFYYKYVFIPNETK